MKKLLAALLAVLLIATACAVLVSAKEAYDIHPEDDGWNVHSIMDPNYVHLYDNDENDYEIPEFFSNGQNDMWFQFWTGSGHLFENTGLNVFGGAKIEITFNGTGFVLGTNYRRNEENVTPVDAISAYLDGEDVTDQLKDLFSETGDNDTTPTALFTVEGLEKGEHTFAFVNTDTLRRYDVDYFMIKDEELPEGMDTETDPPLGTDYVPETKAPETKAPETKAPETGAEGTNASAEGTNAPETKAPEAKKGCKSMVGLSALALVVLAAPVVLAKKH